MKALTLIFLLAVLLLSTLLLWSSNNFKQTAKHMPLGQLSEIDSRHAVPSLPMTFAHADHAKQQCVACHHNYQDDTGQGLCIDCHRVDKEIAFKLRDQFHDLCMGCHMDKRAEGDASGPLRNCRACHTEDHSP